MELFKAVARYLAEERNGKPVFGVMGDANLGYLGTFMDIHDGQYVATALEGGAVSMGDGWARSTGDVGVVSVTHGPSLTNTLTALIEATKSRNAMVVLTGSTPEVNEHFQYVDIEGFARFAGAAFVKVRRADEVLSMLDKAFTRAVAEQLPVILDIPYDILRAQVEYRAPRIPALQSRRRLPDPESVDEALGLLLSAKRPLFIVGRGAVKAGARTELLELARAVNAPVMTTLLAKDYFDGEPENLGIHGSLSTPAAMAYMADVDVVMSFGASLNNFTTDDFSLLANRTVIQTDIEPVALSGFGPATHAIVADAKGLTQALLERLKEAEHEPEKALYMETVAAEPHRESKDLYISTTGEGFIDMRDATRWLSSALPEGAQQVCDVGRFGYSTWPHITVDPERWFFVGAFGSIGLGLATAVGAAAAQPDVPTVLYIGDGGAMQGLAELNTAVRNDLPLVVMVLNDQCYGAEYLKLEDFGSSPDRSRIEWSSFAEVAEGLGMHAVRATSMDELEPAADAIRTGQLPLLIEVIADPERVSNSPGIAPVKS